MSRARPVARSTQAWQAAPALDLLLFAGHQVSRVAGRNELAPEPPRRAAGPGELQARLKRSTT